MPHPSRSGFQWETQECLGKDIWGLSGNLALLCNAVLSTELRARVRTLSSVLRRPPLPFSLLHLKCWLLTLQLNLHFLLCILGSG